MRLISLFFVGFLFLCSCSPVKKVSDKNYKLFGIDLNVNDDSSAASTGSVDRVVAGERLYEEILIAVKNAKSKLYFKNFPSLSLTQTENRPNTLITLLENAQKKGVNIKVVHRAPKRTYPLSHVLLRKNIGDFGQNNSKKDWGYAPINMQYLIVDNKILVIHDPDGFPRWLNGTSDIKDIHTDWNAEWKFAKYRDPLGDY